MQTETVLKRNLGCPSWLAWVGIVVVWLGAAATQGQEKTPWITPGQLKNKTEFYYAEGVRAFEQGDPDAAVHEAYQAASAAWTWITVHSTIEPGQPIDTQQGRLSNIPPQRAVQLYHSAVTLLIRAAQQSHRIDPEFGIRLDFHDGQRYLPIRYHGFAWQPSDFTQWVPVGDYQAQRLVNLHRRQGWGVPLVIVCRKENPLPFMNEQIPFAATAMLRPVDPGEPSAASPDIQAVNVVLEVFESRSIESLPGQQGATAPLAADLSAPLAWIDNNVPRTYLSAFRRPDEGDGKGELQMFEPYQPGKIPVVLVHGLLSDPIAWIGLANELMADPEFTRHYQIWAFRYPTGRTFLASAADLRADFQQLLSSLGGVESDPALGQCVFIGHSMGGLVAKMQVVDSCDTLWHAFANRPIHEMELDEAQRKILTEQFFFEAQPQIKRVIFIGTPHLGSGLAATAVARLGIRQVRRSPEVNEIYRSLQANNPGVINPQFKGAVPTSIQTLQPQDPLLLALASLRPDPTTFFHSIVGVDHLVPLQGDGDGVVPMESARHPGAETEKYVDARHEVLQSAPETVAEIRGILRLHASRYQQLDQDSSSAIHGTDQGHDAPLPSRYLNRGTSVAEPAKD